MPELLIPSILPVDPPGALAPPASDFPEPAAVLARWHQAQVQVQVQVQVQGLDFPPSALIAYAGCSADPAGLGNWQSLLPPGALALLEQLLHGMQPVDALTAPAGILSPSHERALALAIGLGDKLPDGLLPWAALEAALLHLPSSALDTNAATGWAWITPCHWAMGMGDALFTHPAHFPALGEADSRRLLESMRPFWAEDGITLHYAAPHRWLAEGAVFKGLPSASLDQVLGRSIDGWLPAGTPAASKIRRLQGEMQMLLYTHPVNDERSEKRQLPINSFWISGTGDGSMNFAAAEQAAAKAAAIQAPRTLANAFQTGNAPAYAEAWQTINNHLLAAMLQSQRQGQSVHLILSGQKQAITWVSRPAGLASRIKTRFASHFGVSASVYLHEQL